MGQGLEPWPPKAIAITGPPRKLLIQKSSFKDPVIGKLWEFVKPSTCTSSTRKRILAFDLRNNVF